MFLLVICFLSGDKDISRKWAHRGHTPSLFRVSFIPHLTDKAVCKTIRGVFISHRSSLTGVKGLFSAPFALSVDKTNGKVLRKFYQKFNSSIWIPFDFHEKFYFADCRQFFAFHGNKSSWIRIFLSHPGQAFSPAPLRRLGRNMVDNVKFIKIDYISWYLFHGGFFYGIRSFWRIAGQSQNSDFREMGWFNVPLQHLKEFVTRSPWARCCRQHLVYGSFSWTCLFLVTNKTVQYK